MLKFDFDGTIVVVGSVYMPTGIQSCSKSLECEETLLGFELCREILNFCKDFEESLNCQYWTFQGSQSTPDQSTHCTLYEGFNTGTCTSILGPREPHHDMCGKHHINKSFTAVTG